MKGAFYFGLIVCAMLWLGWFASSRAAHGMTHDTPPKRVAYWEMRLGRSGKWAYVCPNGVKSLRACPVKMTIEHVAWFQEEPRKVLREASKR